MKTLSAGRFDSPEAMQVIKQIRAQACEHAQVANSEKTDSKSLVYLGRNKVLGLYIRDFSGAHRIGQTPLRQTHVMWAAEQAALRVMATEAPAIPQEVAQKIAVDFKDKVFGKMLRESKRFDTQHGECIYFLLDISLKAILGK